MACTKKPLHFLLPHTQIPKVPTGYSIQHGQLHGTLTFSHRQKDTENNLLCLVYIVETLDMIHNAMLR